MEAELASQIIRSVTSDKALRRLSEAIDNNELGAAMRSLTTTTQAIDVITGGIKSNALPEEATAIVNHRISVMS
jgi:Gly-Xaa carboxypeptidase